MFALIFAEPILDRAIMAAVIFLLLGVSIGYNIQRIKKFAKEIDEAALVCTMTINKLIDNIIATNENFQLLANAVKIIADTEEETENTNDNATD